LVYKIIVSI